MGATEDRPVGECVLVQQSTLDAMLARLGALERGQPTQSAGATPIPLGARPVEMFPGVVVSSSAGDEDDEFDYQVALVMPGGTGYTGLAKLTGATYLARNEWEELTNAGYESSAVTGIKAIPAGGPVKLFWGVREGKRILLFSERNEATCS